MGEARSIQVGDRVRITNQAQNMGQFINQVGTIIRVLSLKDNQTDPTVFIRLDDRVMPVVTFAYPGWLELVND